MLPFLAATLLSALLLFEVQPLVARAILPGFGGSPAVWTTCMLFFQLLLVAGYGYGHLLIGRSEPKTQARVHIALIAASLLVLGLTALAFGTPLLPPRATHIGASPQLAILGRLALAVGAPYLVLSTTGPLVQAFWGRTFQGSSPYRLYALSNLGSLVGLISYPLALEPLLGLRAQALVWTAGYLLFALSMIAVARQAARAAPGELPVEQEVPTPRPRLRQQLAWLALAAIASTLLLAVTNQLCQEVASIPLLWVLPLGLYLLSFILAFDAPRWYPRALWMPLFLAAVAAAIYFFQRPRLPLPWQITVWSSVLLTGCMVCHGELSRARPPTRYLTGFYLIVACGGASGGIFVALLAPLLFTSYMEVQLALGAGVLAVGAALLADRGSLLRSGPRWRLSLARLALGLLVGGLLVGVRQTLSWSTGVLVARSRSFFGVLKVSESFHGDPVRDRLILTHGRTYHGMQLTSTEGRLQPTTYYDEQSGIGRAIRLHPRRAEGLNIGMCGLGVGTVAAYLRPIDRLRIYEIDPSVIALSASREGIFRYVPEASRPSAIAPCRRRQRSGRRRYTSWGHSVRVDTPPGVRDWSLRTC